MPVAAGKIYPGHTGAHVFLANCADPVCLVYQTCLDDHNVADSVYDSVLDLKWPKQDFLGRDKKVEWKNFQKCCNKSLISRKFPMSSTLLSCRSIHTRSDWHLIYLSCINPLLYIRLWEQRKCKQIKEPLDCQRSSLCQYHRKWLNLWNKLLYKVNTLLLFLLHETKL